MKIDLSTCDGQACAEDEHDWDYDAGDSSVGIEAGWVCKNCGAIHDGPPPDDGGPDWP